jgi:hypothetical protein
MIGDIDGIDFDGPLYDGETPESLKLKAQAHIRFRLTVQSTSILDDGTLGFLDRWFGSDAVDAALQAEGLLDQAAPPDPTLHVSLPMPDSQPWTAEDLEAFTRQVTGQPDIRRCACGCGRSMEGKRADAIYATDACRLRAWRRGRPEAGRLPEMLYSTAGNAGEG